MRIKSRHIYRIAAIACIVLLLAGLFLRQSVRADTEPDRIQSGRVH